MTRKTNIAFCFDSRVIDGVAALVASIAFAASDKNVAIHGLVPENEIEVGRRIKSFAESLGLQFYLDKMNDDAIAALPDRPGLPRATFRRLWQPAIMRERCESYIYLDTDTIVLDDPALLLDLVNDASTVAAVQDVAFDNLTQWLCYHPDAALFSDDVYFNCGVLVIKPRRWQQEQCTERMVQFACKHSAQLLYGDQDAINFVLRGEIQLLANRWNVQIGPLDYKRRVAGRPRPSKHQQLADLAQTGILHYAGGGKPWSKKWFVYHRGLYYKLLTQSGWKTKYAATYERFANKLQGGIAGALRRLPWKS